MRHKNGCDCNDIPGKNSKEAIVIVRYFLLILLVLAFVVFLGCKPNPPKPAEMPVQPNDTGVTIETPEQPAEEPAILPLELSTIYFDYDKYDIRSDAREILSQNGKSLTDHPAASIRIEGNCDERGTEQYNLALGEKRAYAARDYLANYGIDISRMTTLSYGESRPVSMGHNEEAWAKNRRSDFKIVSE
jgi:peptidoglycan-associated lipoprotein